MTHLQNLHQHSIYCDGKDSLEDIILAAIDKGFEAIGFSGHAYTYYTKGTKLSIEKTDKYKIEAAELKKKYADRIKVYCGLEFDMYSLVDLSDYDFLIGSVHYLLSKGVFIPFDRSAEFVKNVIDTYFGGNGLEYAKEYYRTLAELPKFGKFDILGHFDIITKHSENVDFFDTECKEYRHAAIEAAEALAGKIPLFEVNTGAISRGYRTTPYPDPFIIKELRRLGFGAVITSDCHDKNYIDCYFEEAAELLRSCGFTEKYIITDDGFKAVEL